jgi:hypothetical protein
MRQEALPRMDFGPESFRDNQGDCTPPPLITRGEADFQPREVGDCPYDDEICANRQLFIEGGFTGRLEKLKYAVETEGAEELPNAWVRAAGRGSAIAGASPGAGGRGLAVRFINLGHYTK